MKILIFAAVAVAFLQIVSGDEDSDSEECRVFDRNRPCNKCDFSRSYVQYAANPCNRSEYFSCEKTRGYITYHLQVCHCGLRFSDKTWGCTDIITPHPPCPTETPITEIVWNNYKRCYRYGNGPAGLYLQEFADAEGADFEIAYLWYVNEYPVKMPCPPGTYFDFPECKCLHCVPHHNCSRGNPVEFCLDWSDWYGSKRTWYAADRTCSVTDDTHSLVLNGRDCDVEVPYFQKNEFTEFTLCLTFNATRGGIAGLAWDGGRPSDDCHPSIFLELNGNNEVVGGIWTGTPPGPVTVTGPQVPLNTWNAACLRYSDKASTLELLVGDEHFTAPTPVTVSASGSTELNRCNMLLGANVNQPTGEYQYFQGQFGKFCFSRSWIDPVTYHMVGR